MRDATHTDLSMEENSYHGERHANADIPTSAIAKLTNKRCNWFRMERFQNATRHTEMLLRIPTSVVIPSNIPTIRIMPDNGMLHTADAHKVVWS